MDKTKLTTNESNESKDHPAQEQSLHNKPKTIKKSGESSDSNGEPLPSGMSLFIADLRELFREIKKFVIFLRNKRNTNAILIALTLALAIAAFAQAVIYGLQLKPLRDSANAANNAAKAAQDANALTRQELAINQHPWVGFDTKLGGLNLSRVTMDDKMQATVWYSPVVKNFGTYPANRVFTYALLIPLRQYGEDKNANFLDNGGCTPPPDPHIGEVVFPNTSEPAKNNMYDVWPFKAGRDDKISFQIFVVACTTYTDQLGEWNYTRTIYMLVNPTVTPPMPVFLTPKPNAPIAGVWVIRNTKADHPTKH